jgi:hypothetical protein
MNLFFGRRIKIFGAEKNQDIDLGFGRQCHCDHFEWMVSDPNVQNRWVAGLKF